jgi:predicted enzyme related to lactoylglutathione lyase
MIRRIWDITLTVKDLKKAVDFYENVLGLQKKYEFEDYAGFDCGGVEIGLKTWGELEKPRKGEPCINFLVDNLDVAYKILQEKGVKIIKKPKETLWGSRILLFADPDGNILQITEIEWRKYFEVCAPK